MRKENCCQDGPPAPAKNPEHSSLVKAGFPSWDLNLHTVIFCPGWPAMHDLPRSPLHWVVGHERRLSRPYLGAVLSFVTPLSPPLSRIESGCSMLTEASSSVPPRSPPAPGRAEPTRDGTGRDGALRPHRKHRLLSLHHFRRPPTSKKSKYAEKSTQPQRGRLRGTPPPPRLLENTALGKINRPHKNGGNGPVPGGAAGGAVRRGLSPVGRTASARLGVFIDPSLMSCPPDVGGSQSVRQSRSH